MNVKFVVILWSVPMADEPEQPVAVAEEEEVGDELTPGYKPPKQKTLEEITKLDADDESLVKYKQSLLAGADKVLGRPILPLSFTLYDS